MIGSIMLYGTKVALLLTLGALALERVAAWRRLSRRGLWAAALALSLLLPALRLLIPQPSIVPPAEVLHTSSTPVVAPRAAADAPRTRAASGSQRVAASNEARPPQWPRPISVEPLLLPLWLLVSIGLITFYALLWQRLRVMMRRGSSSRIGDQQVWVTEALGPAVWGVIRPSILMPRWVFEGPAPVRALVLAHEQEHIAARDPALLLLGLAAVAIAPWNLLLWWQLRRLRFAIEVDCDARVLRHGEAPAAYGEVLLAVGERRTSMPVGAIALIEPASQLLRRIRIMTADLPKRGTWAVAAAVGLSLASLAVAAEFRAPAFRVRVVGQTAAASALRKLPPGEDPRLADVQQLVRVTYPELFGAAAPATPALVTLLLNRDGTLYKSFRESIEPTPWIPISLGAFDAMGVDYERGASAIPARMEGSATVRNRIDVRAWYREVPADSARDVANVRAKVRARYASLFRPMHADGAHVLRDGVSVVTVFMTEAGDIDRAAAETSQKVQVDGDVDRELQTLATPERFARMGVARERLGLIGTTQLYSGHFFRDHDSKILLVVYAWPRRSNESGPTYVPPEQPEPAHVNDDPAVNRAIAEHYFADLYTFPKDWPRADPWVLLDREGKVLTAGRHVVMSGRDIQLSVESLYPGIRTEGVQVTTVHGGPGQSADVGFVWLAADSPVTDLSKAGKRDALLLYADVIGDGMTRPSELMSLKTGATANVACSLLNPYGVVHLQVTAVAVDKDSVTARIRVQHAQLSVMGEVPDPVDTAWSAEPTQVRAPYGQSTDAQVTDQNGKTWKIVLHPGSLAGAGTGAAL